MSITVRTAWKWGVFALVGCAYLYVKTFGIHPTAGGDENTYFYMARLLAEGKVPYRDFFYAHPPVQLLLLGAVYRLFGYSFVLLKATAFLPLLAGSALIYHAACRRRGMLAGFAFLGVFLFGYESLKISTHPFGLNLTAFFLMLSLRGFLADKPFSCGVWAAVAGLTGLYAAPWALVPAGFYLLRERGTGNFRRYFLAAGGVFLASNLALLAVFGNGYLDPVFIYHFLKPPGSDLIGDVFVRVIRRNPLPFFLPLLYAFSPRDSKTAAVIWAGAVNCLFLLNLNPLFTQYFMMPLLFLSLGGAEALAGWREHFSGLPARRWALAAGIFLVAGVSVLSSRSAVEHERITDYFSLEDTVAYIRDNSSPEDLIFGHVAVSPLLALEAGRRIALDEVDTNHMRFRSGLADLGKVMERLRGEPRLRFFIIQETELWTQPEIRDFLSGARPGRIFQEPRERILIYDLRPEP